VFACRATLREEQALFSAIDQALQTPWRMPRDGFLADVGPTSLGWKQGRC
jgi:hypothetical protein